MALWTELKVNPNRGLRSDIQKSLWHTNADVDDTTPQTIQYMYCVLNNVTSPPPTHTHTMRQWRRDECAHNDLLDRFGGKVSIVLIVGL